MENWQVAAFETKDIMQRDLLSSILADAGFEAFEETNDTLNGYFPAEKFDEKLIHNLLNEVNLAAIKFTIRNLETKNWNETWEKNFSPVVIADKVGIRAPFHQPLATELEIIIEPKMSFGTGHHQTTSLMVQQMLALDFVGKNVLDFGSGTGILSIVAEKLGATNITAIDNEEWAFENAKENAIRNGCTNIDCILGDENTVILDKYAMLLANINRNVILKNIVKWKHYLSPNGVILLSGILVTDEKDIHQKMTVLDFSLIKTIEKDGWLCMQYRSV